MLASRLLGEAALFADMQVVVSEIHGMAQRGGVVESAVILGQSRSPVISDGEADILVGFEPLETLRALRKCSLQSLVISNTSAVLPSTVASGREQYPAVNEIMRKVAARVQKLVAFDAAALAGRAGSGVPVNMVLLGTLIRHGNLPFGREPLEAVLNARTKKSFLEINRKAFDLGYQVE